MALQSEEQKAATLRASDWLQAFQLLEDAAVKFLSGNLPIGAFRCRRYERESVVVNEGAIARELQGV